MRLGPPRWVSLWRRFSQGSGLPRTDLCELPLHRLNEGLKLLLLPPPPPPQPFFAITSLIILAAAAAARLLLPRWLLPPRYPQAFAGRRIPTKRWPRSSGKERTVRGSLLPRVSVRAVLRAHYSPWTRAGKAGIGAAGLVRFAFVPSPPVLPRRDLLTELQEWHARQSAQADLGACLSLAISCPRAIQNKRVTPCVLLLLSHPSPPIG